MQKKPFLLIDPKSNDLMIELTVGSNDKLNVNLMNKNMKNLQVSINSWEVSEDKENGNNIWIKRLGHPKEENPNYGICTYTFNKNGVFQKFELSTDCQYLDEWDIFQHYGEKYDYKMEPTKIFNLLTEWNETLDKNPNTYYHGGCIYYHGFYISKVMYSEQCIRGFDYYKNNALDIDFWVPLPFNKKENLKHIQTFQHIVEDDKLVIIHDIVGHKDRAYFYLLQKYMEENPTDFYEIDQDTGNIKNKQTGFTFVDDRNGKLGSIKGTMYLPTKYGEWDKLEINMPVSSLKDKNVRQGLQEKYKLLKSSFPSKTKRYSLFGWGNYNRLLDSNATVLYQNSKSKRTKKSKSKSKKSQSKKSKSRSKKYQTKKY